MLKMFYLFSNLVNELFFKDILKSTILKSTFFTSFLSGIGWKCVFCGGGGGGCSHFLLFVSNRTHMR